MANNENNAVDDGRTDAVLKLTRELVQNVFDSRDPDSLVSIVEMLRENKTITLSHLTGLTQASVREIAAQEAEKYETTLYDQYKDLITEITTFDFGSLRK